MPKGRQVKGRNPFSSEDSHVLQIQYCWRRDKRIWHPASIPKFQSSHKRSQEGRDEIYSEKEGKKTESIGPGFSVVGQFLRTTR
ncbi:hypothetical protein CDAR_48991 [Caerostris darwini]|uniref:Uncharacterized protein n=1 Tax=Caerostris darwini TaxID=1538125 RepID=A0AAV4NM35_9ARAC|nr:hypothetical protein CDAR_48991 [Caerostris darwini]